MGFRIVEIKHDNETGVDFTGIPLPSSIFGTITMNGEPLFGVTVTISGDTNRVTHTNTQGQYIFHLQNGSYTVTPTLAGYTFTPDHEDFVDVDNNNIQQDFLIETYSISGTVTYAGNEQENVTVTLSGDDSAITHTLVDGTFIFEDLPNGSYTVTPTLQNFIFDPVNNPIIVSNTNVTDINFASRDTTLRRLGGTVHDAGHVPPESVLSGVTITLSGDDNDSTITDINGEWHFNKPDGNYTFTPSKIGYKFIPDDTTWGSWAWGHDDAGFNFYTRGEISGSITGTSIPSGVTLTLTGGTLVDPIVITTDVNNVYSFESQEYGTYTVTPSKDDYTFTPPSGTVTLSTSHTNWWDINFEAAANEYTFELYSNDLQYNNLNGVEVRIVAQGAAPVVTTPIYMDGHYQLVVPYPGGIYNIKAYKDGYYFNDPRYSSLFEIISSNGGFYIYPHEYIRGVISDINGHLGGVTMTLTSPDLPSPIVTTSDINGDYEFKGIGDYTNVTYTITPTLDGYTFDPANIVIAIDYSVVTNTFYENQNFLATAATTLNTPLGMFYSIYPATPSVVTLLEDGDDLYVGGTFDKVRTHYGRRICKIDTTYAFPDSNFLGRDDGFNRAATGFNNVVNCAVKSGNYMFCGGLFTAYNGVPCYKLAKIDLTTGELADGFITNAFTTNVSECVTALTLSSDGLSLYVGGKYMSAYMGTPRQLICKISTTDGALDANFNTSTGITGAAAAQVYSMVLGTSDDLYVAGWFTAYKGISSQMLIKMDATTAIKDVTFSPGTNLVDQVTCMYKSGNQLWIGGTFAAYGGISRRGICKLDATDAALDPIFIISSSVLSTSVRCIISQDDGAYLYVSGSANRYVAKINGMTAAVDPVFNTGTNPFAPATFAGIDRMAISGDDLYLGGRAGGSYMTMYRGIPREGIVKVNSTSAACDMSFNSSTAFGSTNTITDLILDGSDLYIVGDFDCYGGTKRKSLAKFNKNTFDVDQTFSTGTGFNNQVQHLAINSNDLYVGGTFTTYNGITRGRLAKLNKLTGALDTYLNGVAGFDGNIYCLAYDNINSHLYVGGAFTTFNGVASPGIAKLNAAGTNLYASILNGSFLSTYSMQLDIAAGKLYIGGSFGYYIWNGTYILNAKQIIKLNAADALADGLFDTGLIGDVNALALDSANTCIYALGNFTNIAQRIVKLNSNTGVKDVTFDTTLSGFNDTSGGGELRLDGNNLYCGSSFITYKGTARQRVAKLNATNAALDSGFDTASGFSSAVNTIIKSGTSLLVGGNFTSYKGVAAQYLNKISLIDAT